jgi:hypothetical protein
MKRSSLFFVLVYSAFWANDNRNIIPTPPLLISYYTAEISKLDLAIEKIEPPMDKWNEFQRAYPLINPKIYEEKRAINRKIFDVIGTMGNLTLRFSNNGETRYTLSPKKHNEPINSDVKKEAEELPERLKEIDWRIHYEMKREFLKRIQSAAL